MDDLIRRQLYEFLQTPLNSGTAILERFASLPGAIYHQGAFPLQRFVYVPGTRKDRVLLMAHVDTVWDTVYGFPAPSTAPTLCESDGILRSAEPDHGLGADDRAGCAMLWLLRNSGHSLLLTDGEEFGGHGAIFLRTNYPRIMAELNRHHYMISLDAAGTQMSFNHVVSTEAFHSYLQSSLGLTEDPNGSGSDIRSIDRYACGVILGIGFYSIHLPEEFLELSEWLQTLERLQQLLAQPQPRFRAALLLRIRTRLSLFKSRVLKQLHLS